MATAGTFGSGRRLECRVGRAMPLRRRRLRRERCGFPDGIGQCQEVIWPGLVGCGRHRQPEDFPAAGNCQRPGMLLAQIVTMRLGIRSQGAQDCSGVCVYVRQCSHRRLAAA